MGLAILALAAGIAAAPVPAPTPPDRPLADAAHAIEVGRLDQARMMIAEAVKAGAHGDTVNRLLADLAFARDQNALALTQYQDLLVRQPHDSQILERAGIAALRLGQVKAAWSLLDRATAQPSASWRAWDARGATADELGDWTLADFAYARAAALAPDQAEIANNRGWSHFLRGDWPKALELVKAAATLDPDSPRIRNNVELLTAALSEDLPERRTDETDSAWAARLNDAGVVARLSGSSARAVAAFTQAIEARSQWYERAANNLALAEAQP
jgi:tetratricopeptide (TPR) repeat protein